MLNRFIPLLRARSLLLPLYYYSTWPARQLALRATCLAGRSPVMILFYHRVADCFPNAWTISNRDFQEQVEWLTRRFEVISLNEAQWRIASGADRRPAVCISFDDGYAENCDQALPMLLERRIPFTYFVASNFAIQNKPFPHDEARGQPLPPNTPAQLRSLAEQGVDIGAHSRSHADLGSVFGYQALWDEIAGSRDDLEQMLGRPVRYFAFPYGQHENLTPVAFQVAADAGFAAVCSAYGGYNFPGTDTFHLQRLHGDPDLRRIKNWLTFDPRIALGVRRFQYTATSDRARNGIPGWNKISGEADGHVSEDTGSAFHHTAPIGSLREMDGAVR